MAKKGGFGFGIVGCGMIGEFHAQAIKAMRGGHLECAFDLRKEGAQKLADRHGCTAYDNYDDFLAHPGLDVVTIGTPSGAHLEPTVKAARAGKHIICEKPMEVTLERIDRMIRECRKNKVTLAGIFPRRFNDSTIEFKKAIEKKRLGRIAMADAYIKWFRTQEYYDSGGWRGTWKLDGGGALMNQSIHTIDLLIHLAGDIKSVCAFADRLCHKRIEVEDIACAVLRFKSGAAGVIEGSTNCYSKDGHAAEVQICGSHGSIFMKDDKFSVWDFAKKLPADKGIVSKYGSRAGSAGVGAADPSAISFLGHQRNFESTVRAIKDGRCPPVDGKEARKSIEVILAIYKSALAGGKRVDLPLNKTPARKSFR